jgi:hypothetical protein
MKLKLIAAAAVLAASGAQASMTLPSTGDSSFLFNLYDSSSQATFSADLGISYTQWTGTDMSVAGIKLVWDLDAGTFSDLSATATGLSASLNYGTVFTSFMGEVNTANLGFDVKAGDRNVTFNPAAGANSLLTTSSAATVSAQNGQQLGALGVLNTAMTAMNADAVSSTHATAANGANKFDAGETTTSYFDGQGANLKNLSFSTGASINESLNFFKLTNSGSASNGQTVVTAYAGTWSFDAATNSLIYQTAPVPEPETYAMLLAGLGLMGAVARRRRQA